MWAGCSVNCHFINIHTIDLARILCIRLSWSRSAAKTFRSNQVRERVIPVYMGLVRQIDDQLGCLFAYMRKRGIYDKTMIVFTSDHGDYPGDHWLGEKDQFHESPVKVPLIIVNATANETRGSVSGEMVDLGDDPAYQKIRQGMRQLTIDWRRRLKPRVGRSYHGIGSMDPMRNESHGIIIGRW